ncbi:hypothetical protein AB0C52_28395 [Streptomyces sp. NPDC048717]
MYDEQGALTDTAPMSTQHEMDGYDPSTRAHGGELIGCTPEKMNSVIQR